MSRRPNLIPSVMLNVALPQDAHTQLTLHLFSELEGRVPLGAYQRFITERIREWFGQAHLDLGRWANEDEGRLVVSGPKNTIQALERLLNGELK